MNLALDMFNLRCLLALLGENLREGLGIIFSYMDSLAYGGQDKACVLSSQSKDVTYPYDPVFPSVWTQRGSYRRSRNFSTNFGPILNMTWDSHIWKFFL